MYVNVCINVRMYVCMYACLSFYVCLYFCAFAFFDLDMCQQCKETHPHICTAQDMAGRGCHVKTSAEAGGNWLRGCGSRGLAGGAPPGWNEKKMQSANMIKHV